MVQESICEVCGPYEEDREQHLSTMRHALNFYLYLRETKRNKYIKYSGIFIATAIQLNIIQDMQIEDQEARGIYYTGVKRCKFIQLNGKLQFAYTIINQNAEPMFFKVTKLYPMDCYYISGNETNEIILDKDEQWQFFVTFQLKDIINGVYQLPIAITVQPINNSKNYKTLFRDLIVAIKDQFTQDEDVQTSPFQNEHWDRNVAIVPPINCPKHINNYPLPQGQNRVYLAGCKPFPGELFNEQRYRMEMQALWKNGVDRIKYAQFFHTLLWVEECTQVLGLAQYNMSNVRIRMVRKNVILDVPGLAEKRPSVLRGDMVKLRLVSDHTAYTGVVETVEDESVIIEYLDETFVSLLKEFPDVEIDVSFVLSRCQLERMHRGVESCVENGMLLTLFPQKPLNQFQRKAIKTHDLINTLIAENQQQLIAVESILSGTSQRAPYIIYGPPGTGKTVTLVEAILQIKKHYAAKHILVCAPSNAACDMLALKLHEQLNQQNNSNGKSNELFRIHSSSRNPNDIPTEVKYFSNLEGEDFYMLKANDLYNYNIIISTLHYIGKYAGDYSPDVVFIDEAAQATEAECDIPIGLLTPDKQIILAGDPKQLGPVLGKLASDFGLGKSLMDRLMETNELYHPLRKEPLIYDNNYITMLIHNYRSDKGIIKIPNDLFYMNSLQHCEHFDPISEMSIASMLIDAPNAMNGQMQPGASVEFIGLLAKEQRNGTSPSYYNDIEIDMVIRIIKCLLELPNTRVVPKQIGVIAPYIRQVVKIRNKLNEMNLSDLQVGTTEAFQGGERRIMVISTVRAQSDLLRYDKKYDLGFVKHERRFNVAITRAKTKLIIVGNPYVLGYDTRCWGKMIQHCEQLQSYHGVEYKPRTERVREKIYKQINLQQSDRNTSRRRQ